MHEAVDGGRSGHGVSEDAVPLTEDEIAGDHQALALELQTRTRAGTFSSVTLRMRRCGRAGSTTLQPRNVVLVASQGLARTMIAQNIALSRRRRGTASSSSPPRCAEYFSWWSSSPVDGMAGYYWSINFTNGALHSADGILQNARYPRCVR
jgi:hypothetical protein